MTFRRGGLTCDARARLLTHGLAANAPAHQSADLDHVWAIDAKKEDRESARAARARRDTVDSTSSTIQARCLGSRALYLPRSTRRGQLRAETGRL